MYLSDISIELIYRIDDIQFGLVLSLFKKLPLNLVTKKDFHHTIIILDFVTQDSLYKIVIFLNIDSYRYSYKDAEFGIHLIEIFSTIYSYFK